MIAEALAYFSGTTIIKKLVATDSQNFEHLVADNLVALNMAVFGGRFPS